MKGLFINRIDKYVKATTFIMACIIVWVLGIRHVQAFEDEKRVLFISSYSADTESAELQIDGVKSVLGDQVELNYEFMDANILEDESSRKLFFDKIKYKVDRTEKYDVIIVADDPALRFMIDYGEELFKGIPVVFEGISDFQLAAEAGKRDGYNGIVEQISYDRNIDLGRKLFPETTKIIAIVDNTAEGVKKQEKFLEMKDIYPDIKFGMINVSDYDYEDLKTRLSDIGNGTLILYLSCDVDIYGNHYPESEIWNLISTSTKVPVFTVEQPGIGKGLFGGYIVSYREAGIYAARVALGILNGEETGIVKVNYESPNYYMFDFQLIKKYNIKMSLMPQDSKIINEDVSILKKNAGIIIPTLMYTIGGIILIGFTGLLSHLRERNKLIRKVNNKNSQLQNAVERAEQASLQAKKASNAKTDFLSRMSHDIRTPMNAIIGLTEITKSCADDPKLVRNNLERIDRSSKYLLDLINDILAMSRIESGKEALRLERFDMRETLRSIRDIIQTQSVMKEVTFVLKMDDSVRKFYVGDCNKIKQIIMNLLSNALKFTNPQDQIELEAKEISRDEEESEIELIVEDTGIGVEPEFLEKMFEPFEQAEKDMSRNHTGSGLGLSIVKHFVEMMDGSIRVESEEGIGTKFTICLKLKNYLSDEKAEESEYYGTGLMKNNEISIPTAAEFFIPDVMIGKGMLEAEERKREADAVNKKNTEEDNSDEFEGMNLLLAEDNEINLEIAQTILEMRGVAVDAVRNGLDAVERFREMPEDFYQCILMDIRMPVMNGIEAAKAIRSCDRQYASKVPIIALTANAFQEDIESTKKAGMNAHLSKPIQPDVMFAELKKIISSHEKKID